MTATTGLTINAVCINPAQDVPSRVLAYKKGAFGEVALVLQRGRCVLVHAFQDEYRVATATGWTLPVLADGELVSAERAVELLNAAKGETMVDTPETYRGQWAAQLVLEVRGNTLRTTLVMLRRVATYALVGLECSQGAWSWRVQRAGKWFTQEKGTKSQGPDSFEPTLRAALAAALDLVADACVVRDTRRQGALDPAWAATHPPKPRREPTDPTGRLLGQGTKAPTTPKGPRQPRKAAFKLLRRLEERGSPRDPAWATALADEQVTAGAASVKLRHDHWSIYAFADGSALAVADGSGEAEGPWEVMPVKPSRNAWRELDPEGKPVKGGWSLDPSKKADGWRYFVHDDDVPAAMTEIRINRDVRPVLRQLEKKKGFKLDRSLGHLFARLDRAWNAYPVNSLYLSTGDEAGFYVHKPVAGELEPFAKAPRAPKEPKAPKELKAPKEPKAPKAPNEPKAPKAPKALSSPSPAPAATAPAVDAAKDQAMLSSIRDILRAELRP